MCPFTDSFAVKPFVNLNCEGRSSHSSWLEHISMFIELVWFSWDPAHKSHANFNPQ
jgi:hypothetical protein